MNNRVIEENVTWMMIVLSKTFLACVADVIKPWLTRSLVSSVAQVACEQALCLGKNSEEREGKGGREPVDKHLRPLFRLL